MQFNKKFRIFGIIVGVLMLGGLVGVMALTVQRAQQLTSTITRPKAAGGCTGTLQFYNDNGGDCRIKEPYEADKCNKSPQYPNCFWDDLQGGDSCRKDGWTTCWCPRQPTVDCSTLGLTTEAACLAKNNGVSVPKKKQTCKWEGGGGGGTGYFAVRPINNEVVSSLTPTFTWTANTTGVTYNNICIGTNSACADLPCNWSPSTSDRSYALPAGVLQPNTTYYWVLYGQPGNPAPSTGCQSFRTGAGVSVGRVQGCKVLGDNTTSCYQADSAPFYAKIVTLDGVTESALGNGSQSSYSFPGVTKGVNHTVTVPSAPTGYTVSGYSLCYGGINCHSGLTASGSTVAVNIPANADYADLWWHFAAVASCVDSQCPDTQKCGSSNTCVDVVCVTAAPECKRNVIANHTCTVQNITDGTACGTTGSGNTCQSGVCTAPSCPSGQTLCSGVCKNLQTDSANCGACGNVCTSGQTCTGAVCVTPAACTSDSNCSGGELCAFP